MAKTKNEEKPPVEQQPACAGPVCPPPSDYVIIVNLTKSPKQCPLRTGRSVSLGPRLPGQSIHKSAPILKKDRTDILFQWEKKGVIAFEAPEGGAL